MLPYFANFRLLAEFSTPCVNQRYVSSLKMGKSLGTVFLSFFLWKTASKALNMLFVKIFKFPFRNSTNVALQFKIQ